MDSVSSSATRAAALSGIRAATLRLDTAAQSISGRAAAGPHHAGRDEITDLVDLIVARTDFKANVAVLRTNEQMMGALLDILA